MSKARADPAVTRVPWPCASAVRPSTSTVPSGLVLLATQPSTFATDAPIRWPNEAARPLRSAAAARRLAPPGRRRRQLVRERRRAAVPRHLPPRRPRLRAGNRRARCRGRVGGAARRRDRGGSDHRPRRPPPHARGGPRRAGGGLRPPAARPSPLARVRADGGRGRRRRLLLAEPVDAGLAPDAGDTAPRRVRAAAT